jgi:hypothetical protein
MAKLRTHWVNWCYGDYRRTKYNGDDVEQARQIFDAGKNNPKVTYISWLKNGLPYLHCTPVWCGGIGQDETEAGREKRGEEEARKWYADEKNRLIASYLGDDFDGLELPGKE